jgi:phosphatidylinositol glycan class F
VFIGEARTRPTQDWVILTAFASPLVGAWVGAFAIPLDWDRPWQPWPISSAYAAFGAYSLALLGCALATWAAGSARKVKSG